MESQATDYLSTIQVANLLGVHQNTVLKWIREGRLPARRFGVKLWRILRSDVEKMGQGNG
ncbi:hypothetical protein LCGC14_0955050 [marine sediment metagenome]|uniref:Helix-turn-helix domain-containing protein n=1 Tax=marine sediment metagenome TaxID=412755 RepID=A0A0F9NKP1_9ZZZZ